MRQEPRLLFSDYFEIGKEVLDKHDAYNISLVADLPLFIDPFLLFNSDKSEYKKLHDEIIKYLRFLRDKSLRGIVDRGLLLSLYRFSEVWQNWFGYTKRGNKGSALGYDFAEVLNRNFHSILKNYGQEEITKSPHLEKLCLFKEGVGKDNISDFTTNLIKDYLLCYTENFSRKYLKAKFCDNFRVQKVRFRYDTETWAEKSFYLPRFGSGVNDFVILTPKDLLTKDETWINRRDLIEGFFRIPNSIANEELRAKVNNYLRKMLPDDPTKSDEKEVAQKALREFPFLMDYYIRLKEEQGGRAADISQQKVKYTEDLYLDNFKHFALLLSKTPFYKLLRTNSYAEALKRAKHLKHVVEDNDGYRIFYLRGKFISKEEDLKILYRLTWFGSLYDFNTEVNNGRGPVDSSVSMGSLDKTVVEFKLASNPKLKSNLQKQVEIYQRASNAQKSIKIIFYFTAQQMMRVKKILKELGLEREESIILVDARNDNKPSASKA